MQVTILHYCIICIRSEDDDHNSWILIMLLIMQKRKVIRNFYFLLLPSKTSSHLFRHEGIIILVSEEPDETFERETVLGSKSWVWFVSLRRKVSINKQYSGWKPPF